MKTTILTICTFVMLASCNNKPEDSTEAADKTNDVKFDKDNYEKDAEFAVKAADAGMFEVAVAELALSRSSNADVKAMATMIKTDHSAANTELMALCMKKNMTLPDSMSADHRDKYDKLAKKEGKDFDNDYVDMTVKGHKDVIDLFEKESENGNEQEVKSWATAKLTTLRHHLSMAEETEDKLKK